MNRLVSYDWLKHYADLEDVSPEEFAKRISLSGPAVEKIFPADALLHKVVVGHVLEVKRHPNADKLKLAIVNVGTQHTAPVQIVCGGSNLRKDQWVAVALVGAYVKWHGEGEPVKLEPVELRGEKSEGMICAANEIGLADAFPHEEREILDLEEALRIGVLADSEDEHSKKRVFEHVMKPGTLLADLLGLSGDVIMDVEVTSNRVDAMGMVGFGREAAAILERDFLWEEPVLDSPRSKSRDSQLSVTVHDKDLCPRYMAARINGVKNGSSPWWMKKRLMAAGMNSINLLVDITNYVLLEYAQPLHVFDVARLRKKSESGKQEAEEVEIHVRLAQPQETVKALDGKDYALDDKTLVIADAEGPVAVAGIMGGERSGTYEDTTDIVFEAATFDSVSVRRTARRLNLYSDSQLRFEKGLSTEAPPIALARAIELTLELAGGELAGPVTDVCTHVYKPLSFSIASKEVSARIGVEIPEKKQVEILTSLGFGVKASKGVIAAQVPWWRDHDIEEAQDLVEEIARVYGYANIPAELPVGDAAPRGTDAELVWEDHIRTIAKGAGLTEVYSYSFVSDELYGKAGYDSSACLHVQNPLSEEFAFMRTSLLPSLLQVVAENQERYREQSLFEVANVYYRRGEAWTDLPDESLELGCAFLAGEGSFAKAKGFVEHLLYEFGIDNVIWERFAQVGFWHPGRTAQAFKDGKLLATVGEVSPHILANVKIEGRAAMIDCPLKAIFALSKGIKSFTAPSPYPESKRDLAVIVDTHVEYDDIARAIREADALVAAVEWFDTYAGKGIADGKKSVAMHLDFSSPDRTLTAEEVDGLLQRILLGLKEKFGAEMR